MKNSALLKLIDKIAEDTFGMTPAEARGQGICIDCRQKVDTQTWQECDRQEYANTGLCPTCFDRITGE